ncbi:HAMP domain-containing sensor histidine kinase [Rhizobium bangladeshense]|uniref:HAMP domain-containing sensor histidine kinase n=1 Tax=Rhizobium bangladeshense TaxID=1138189 RepID=UPI001C83F252|nr:ATP-binding protein [Rhizobium bangladeshense]MBX4898725.1 HAMP domain-containing protein [Rhizobium bangladeshense]MBY3616748.1 HAMP domain-containing protein [Rhizobium bangladeshense]
MRRLFRKFFAVIWLTMASTFALMVALGTLLENEPFRLKTIRHQENYTLDLAVQMAMQQGEQALLSFAKYASRTPTPVHLAIKKAELSAACVNRGEPRLRLLVLDGLCYQVAIGTPGPGIIEEYGPKPLIWGAVLAASALAAYLLARFLVHPVALIRQGLSELAQGRFEMRIGNKMSGRKDEVATLAHDFDVTAKRLQELQGNQQKIFHDVSHELRSPLSRLQAAIGVARQNPQKSASMLDRMDREIGRMDELIGLILQLARLTNTSGENLETQRLDVIDLLNEILADAAFEGQTRRIGITTAVPGTFVADVNGELIYRAIENTVRNAIKYSHDGSPVVVDACVETDRLRIIVSNTGSTVLDHELEGIFQPFARASTNDRRDGNGLGLAITRHAVEKHGGRVSAVSNQQPGGLTIILELPRVRAPSPPSLSQPAAHHQWARRPDYDPDLPQGLC